MDKSSQRPHSSELEDRFFDERFSVMSSTECTGLIPAAPVDETAADSYQEIYDIPLSHKQTDMHSRQARHVQGDEPGGSAVQEETGEKPKMQ